MVNEYNNRGDALSNDKGGFDANAVGNNISPRGGINNNL